MEPPPAPAAAVLSRSLLHRLLRLPFLLLSAAPFLPRLRLRLPALSLIAIQDLILSLTFLRCGLVSHTVDVSPGTRVHIWGPARRRRDRPALVLIHGFGGNAKWQWHRQVAGLSASFDIYVPDLLFFGASESTSADRSVGYQAKCVAEAMRKVGVRRYSLCGISYGGFVAYRMAAAEEGVREVERVVVLTAGVGATAEQRVELVEREKRDVCEVLLPQKAGDLMELMRRSMHRPPRWVPEFLLMDFIRVMYMERRREREQMLRELLSNGAGVDPLPVLHQETLILWGNRDKVFPLPMAHQLHRHLGDNSRLEILEDAGHACQLEKADLVNSLIRSFLLRCATGDSAKAE